MLIGDGEPRDVIPITYLAAYDLSGRCHPARPERSEWERATKN